MARCVTDSFGSALRSGYDNENSDSIEVEIISISTTALLHGVSCLVNLLGGWIDGRLVCILFFNPTFYRRQDSAVGIATRYRLDA